MTVSARKITAFAKLVAGLADTPNLGSTTLLKQWFDSSPEELRVAFNGLIDDLIATAAGASGTEQIGSAPITGVAGATAYAQLVDLKNQLNGVVLGQIPDASLDYVKINAATQNLLTEYGIARQAIINGNFDVWQRGTSFSSPAYNTYTTDRFNETGDGSLGTFTISRQVFTPGQIAVPNNPKYFYRHDQTVASTGQTFRNLSQKIENGSLFAGSTFTISFYAKADSARTVSCNAYRNYGTGGSPTAQEQLGVNNAINLTTSWQKFTLVVTASSVTGKTFGSNGDDYLFVTISMPINATFTIDIAQIQVNVGSTALPFQPKSFNDELLACLRYYERVGTGARGTFINATSFLLDTTYKVEKRIAPTPTLLTTTPAISINGAYTTGSASALSSYLTNTTRGGGNLISGFTGQTVGASASINQDNLVAFDAEF